jgi:hypothetical protein
MIIKNMLKKTPISILVILLIQGQNAGVSGLGN